jgi:hypothetical protein
MLLVHSSVSIRSDAASAAANRLDVAVTLANPLDYLLELKSLMQTD